MASCLRRTRTALSIMKALLSRSLFTLHGLMCIWRVTLVQRSAIYWSLAGTLPLMVLETVYTLCKKKDGEWKWVCPSVFLYLGTAVPAIWFLELDLMRQRIMIGPPKRPPGWVSNSTKEVLLLNGQIQLAISLDAEEWCKILEQMLLLVLIVGRWLLPKGEITREQLSQLLLVYIGMAADIIELFEAFKEKTVRENRLLTLIILSLWTGSLSQFTLVVTAAKSKKTRPVVFRSTSPASASCGKGAKSCCPTEVLSILISVLLQDAPFLVLRMLLIFRYDVVSHTNIFFTAKNTLVLMLQIYRLFVLFSDKSHHPPKETTHANNVARMSSSNSGSSSYSTDSDDSLSESESYISDSGHSTNGRYRSSKNSIGWTSSLERDIRFEKSPRTKRRTGDVIRQNHVAEKRANGVAFNNYDDSESDEVRRTPKTRHKTLQKKGKDAPGTPREDRRRKNDGVSSMDKRDRKKSKGGKREWSEGGEPVPQGRRQLRLSPEVEKQVKKIEDRDKTSSPLPPPPPPPPPPPDMLIASDVSEDDVIEHNGGELGRKKHSKKHSATSPKKDSHNNKHHHRSPKAGDASNGHHRHQRHHHHHHHHQHQQSPKIGAKLNSDNNSKATTKSKTGNQSSISHVSKSPSRKHWKKVKDVRSALTFMDEKGVFRTVVLKPMADGTSFYVVDNDLDIEGQEHDMGVNG